ncbi:serpin family protein [Chloroflexota bacterium]
MKKILLILLSVVLMLAVVGCTQPASGDVLKSDKPRETALAVATGDLSTLVEGNNTCAFNLYQELRDTSGNLFYSPYSISQALAMAYAGAQGQTGQDMFRAMNFMLTQERLHPAFNSLDLMLAERGQGAQGKDGEGFRLNVVNAIWGQKDYIFLDGYLDVLAQNYGAGLRILDFINQSEPSRVTINDWVSDQTEDRIKDLIPQGVINRDTRLVLTNAIYFNAAWQTQFSKSTTTNGVFHAQGGDVNVPMMQKTASFAYTNSDKYQAVELPYDGNELSMVILLPREGQFDSFEQSLDWNGVKQAINGLQRGQVALTMPKFEFESSFGLKKALTGLGMGVAFTENADFSGMNGKRDLLIQDVLHKAFVSVDENGTEAAAATAVIVGTTSMPAEPVGIKIDRPFLFLIRDIETGSLLFVGRVLNPAS